MFVEEMHEKCILQQGQLYLLAEVFSLLSSALRSFFYLFVRMVIYASITVFLEEGYSLPSLVLALKLLHLLGSMVVGKYHCIPHNLPHFLHRDLHREGKPHQLNTSASLFCFVFCRDRPLG